MTIMKVVIVVFVAIDETTGALSENGSNLVRELFEGHKRAHFQLKFGLLDVDDINARFVGNALQSAGKPDTKNSKEKEKGFTVINLDFTHKCLMPTMSERRIASLLLSK
jgi:hypothetical protein